MKILYPLAITVVLIIVYAVFLLTGSSLLVLFVVAGLFLIPGRVAGFFYRGIFSARRRSDAGDLTGALTAIDGFLADIAAHPGRKRWHWFLWQFYTGDVEAMAENNAGAILLQMGDLDAAERRFVRSLSIDPEYAIPHRNMAAVWELRGDDERAEHWSDLARRLGYRDTAADRLIGKGAGRFAKVEGRYGG